MEKQKTVDVKKLSWVHYAMPAFVSLSNSNSWPLPKSFRVPRTTNRLDLSDREPRGTWSIVSAVVMEMESGQVKSRSGWLDECSCSPPEGLDNVKLMIKGSGQANLSTRPGAPLNGIEEEGYPPSIKGKSNPRRRRFVSLMEGSRVRVPRIWGRV